MELSGLETAEICHIATHQIDVQPFAICDEFVFRELCFGTVEAGDGCSCGSENRRLLPTSGCETQDVFPCNVAKPGFWHVDQRCENDFPVAVAGVGDGLLVHGLTPRTLVLVGLVIPGIAVVSGYIDHADIMAQICC